MIDSTDTGDKPRRELLRTMAGFGAGLGIVLPNTSTVAATSPISPMTESLPFGGDWLDVRTFGARCDGKSDDTSAVQAAIDAANATSLPRPVLIPGPCRLSRPVHVRRKVDTTRAVLRIVGAGGGAGFVINHVQPMFSGSTNTDGSPGTEFIRFETIRFEATTNNCGPVMTGEFLRVTFILCEFIAISCLITDKYAQEWRFIACVARRWHGPFFSAAGGYAVTSTNCKYQFGGPVFRLVDQTLRTASCVGCSFVQDIYEGSNGPFLELELGKGVAITNLHAEDIESPTIVLGSRARSMGITVSGCFFGTRPDNVKAENFGEIVWNAVSGAVSIGNVAVGRLHQRDERAINFSSIGDHDGVLV